MSHINRNYPILVDIRLTSREYYDFQISDYFQICNCDDQAIPITCLLLNNTTKIKGDTIWAGAVSQSGTVLDFGITGYDNRFVPYVDSDLVLNDDKKLTLKAVNGDNFCYDILSGDSDGVFLCGGFFQGHYKLNGFIYETLPEFYHDGWTMEFNIQKTFNCTCVDPLINDMYPENDGIFFYYGTRAENKFCSIKEELLKYEVQSGVTYLESIVHDKSHIEPNENPFLFYTCKNLIDYFATHTGTTLDLGDCCAGLTDNALAFRITPEGKIGYRYLTSTGTCVDRKFVSDFAVMEQYSDFEITDELFHLITVKFQNYDYLECKPNKPTYGVLSIYVDGLLKLRKYDFPNKVPYKFNVLDSEQLGVTQNISIGGGTQGLLESPKLTPRTVSVCDYKFYIKKDQTFLGIILNDNVLLSDELSYYDSDAILDFLNLNILNTFKDITVTKTPFYIEFNIKFSEDILTDIIYSGPIYDNSLDCCSVDFPAYSQQKPFVCNCFTFETDNNHCGVLEENFAGTFIGRIKSFCLYDFPLSLSQIRCNKTNLYS